MPLTMSKSFDALQEGLLGDAFFADCWPTGLPEAQRPPSSAELRDLDAALADDRSVAALGAADRAAVRAAVLDVERRVPFLSASGQALPTPHRLFLALEIARVFRAFPRDDVARLASVVVYPGVTKLRRGRSELGALLMRGPFRLLPLLRGIADGATLLHDVATHGGKPLKAWRRTLRSLIDDADAWRAQIAPGRALPDQKPALVAFADRARTAFHDSAVEARRSPALTEALARADLDLGSVTADRAQVCALLKDHADDLDVPAQASIHLSWATQVACHTTTGHDPLIHELAHLADFSWSGIDGAPLATTAERWKAAWQDLEAGGLDGLDPYARTSPAELLAVATEAFFTDAEALRRASPSLASLLEDTWGWAPAPRPRRSNWWVMKRLLLRRHGGVFD